MPINTNYGMLFPGSPSFADMTRNRSTVTPQWNQWVNQRNSVMAQNPYTGSPYAGIYGSGQGGILSNYKAPTQLSGGMLATGNRSTAPQYNNSPYLYGGGYGPSMFAQSLGGIGGANNPNSLGALLALLGSLSGKGGYGSFTRSPNAKSGVFTGSGWDGIGSPHGAWSPFGPVYY